MPRLVLRPCLDDERLASLRRRELALSPDRARALAFATLKTLPTGVHRTGTGRLVLSHP